MALGDLIRTSRAQRGFSLSELARQAKVSKSYLHRLEKSSQQMRPSAEVLYRLGIALGIPLPQLLNRTIESQQGDDLAAAPDSLRQFAVAEQLPHEVVRMLSRIEYMGARPGTVEDFSFLLQAIKRTVGVRHEPTVSGNGANNTLFPAH